MCGFKLPFELKVLLILCSAISDLLFFYALTWMLILFFGCVDAL